MMQTLCLSLVHPEVPKMGRSVKWGQDSVLLLTDCTAFCPACLETWKTQGTTFCVTDWWLFALGNTLIFFLAETWFLCHIFLFKMRLWPMLISLGLHRGWKQGEGLVTHMQMFPCKIPCSLPVHSISNKQGANQTFAPLWWGKVQPGFDGFDELWPVIFVSYLRRCGCTHTCGQNPVLPPVLTADDLLLWKLHFPSCEAVKTG